jgi:hypothetical protein
MLGDDLIKEVLNTVNNISVPDGWNRTTIVMILKIDDPDKVS